jgi:hypothetical protein
MTEFGWCGGERKQVLFEDGNQKSKSKINGERALAMSYSAEIVMRLAI